MSQNYIRINEKQAGFGVNIHDISHVFTCFIEYIRNRGLADNKIILGSGCDDRSSDYKWLLVHKLIEQDFDGADIYVYDSQLDKADDYKLFDYSDRESHSRINELFGVYIRNYGTYVDIYFYEDTLPFNDEDIKHLEHLINEIPNTKANIYNLVKYQLRYNTNDMNNDIVVLRRDKFRSLRDIK